MRLKYSQEKSNFSVKQHLVSEAYLLSSSESTFVVDIRRDLFYLTSSAIKSTVSTRVSSRKREKLGSKFDWKIGSILNNFFFCYNILVISYIYSGTCILRWIKSYSVIIPRTGHIKFVRKFVTPKRKPQSTIQYIYKWTTWRAGSS